MPADCWRDKRYADRESWWVRLPSAPQRTFCVVTFGGNGPAVPGADTAMNEDTRDITLRPYTVPPSPGDTAEPLRLLLEARDTALDANATASAGRAALQAEGSLQAEAWRVTRRSGPADLDAAIGAIAANVAAAIAPMLPKLLQWTACEATNRARRLEAVEAGQAATAEAVRLLTATTEQGHGALLAAIQALSQPAFSRRPWAAIGRQTVGGEELTRRHTKIRRGNYEPVALHVQ